MEHASESREEPGLLPCSEEMARDCEMLGVRVAEEELARFESFALMVASRCRLVNLMGPNELTRLWPRHFLESVAFASMLEKAPVVDIGSGAGFPGMVLGILGWEVVLLEPKRKKALFLEFAVERLGLGRISVERSRLEDYGGRSPQYTARSVKAGGELLDRLGALGALGATLTVREPADGPHEGAVRESVMPVPPLDRAGAVVQYRVGCLIRGNHRRTGGDSPG